MRSFINTVLLLVFSLWKISFGQVPIVELEFDNSVIDGIKGAAVNDSLFLTIEGVRTATSLKRNFYWIRSDGQVRTMPLALDKNQFIYAIGYTKDEEFYYYPIEIKKKIFLKALIVDKRTGTLLESSQQVEIPGMPYGSYVEDGSLYLLLAEKNKYTLQLVRITGLEIESRTEFRLTFDLGSLKPEQAKFYTENQIFIPSNGFSPIKITKHSDTIWISIDESRQLNSTGSQPGTIYKTTVINLNLNDPEKSIVKTFIESRFGYFSSKISNQKLFRIYRDFESNTVSLDVFDITTSQRLFSRTFANKSDFAETNYYHRDVENKIERQITTKPFFRMGSDLAYIESKSASRYLLAIGYEYEYKSSPGLLHGFGLMGILASAAAKALVSELSNGQLTYKYVYLELDLDGTLTTANDINLLAKKIDDFEIDKLIANSSPRVKGYLATDKNVFVFYTTKKSPALKIYSFSK